MINTRFDIDLQNNVNLNKSGNTHTLCFIIVNYTNSQYESEDFFLPLSHKWIGVSITKYSFQVLYQDNHTWRLQFLPFLLLWHWHRLHSWFWSWWLHWFPKEIWWAGCWCLIITDDLWRGQKYLLHRQCVNLCPTTIKASGFHQHAHGPHCWFHNSSNVKSYYYTIMLIKECKKAKEKEND